MNTSHRPLLALTALVSLACAAEVRAESGGVKVGILTCTVASGWGLIFGSSKDLHCTFAPRPDRAENYVGKIKKYGVDLGYQKGGVMAWAVLAPTVDLAPGSLAGSYGGATAGGAVGVGGSANVLVGGSNKSISLQPLSIEGTTGLNIAAGVAAIDLTYKP
jgi:uncharacterized protein DUF992